MGEEQKAFWSTPSSLDIRNLAAAYSLPYREGRCAEDVAIAISWAQSKPGVSILHLRLPSDSARRYLLRVERRVRDALMEGTGQAVGSKCP